MPLRKNNPKREPVISCSRIAKSKKLNHNKHCLSRTRSPSICSRRHPGQPAENVLRKISGINTRHRSRKRGEFSDEPPNIDGKNEPLCKFTKEDSMQETSKLQIGNSTNSNLNIASMSSFKSNDKDSKEIDLLDSYPNTHILQSQISKDSDSSSEETASISSQLDDMDEHKLCTFKVIGSNPGEPKKRFANEDKVPENKAIHVYLKGTEAGPKKNDKMPCEGRDDPAPFCSILKRNPIEQEPVTAEKDGGDTGPRSYFDESDIVAYCYQPFAGKKKGTKKVNFRPQVDVIQFAGGEGCRVISRAVEPLKNERIQQARNVELRKGYLMLKFQKVEAWHKNIKFIKS